MSTSTLAAKKSSRRTVADAIENTLAWLDEQGCTSRPTERRSGRRSRYRVVAHISYTPPGGTGLRSFDVQTRNLSRQGLSFLHRTLIYPRQAIEVQLPLPDHSVRKMTARVARVRTASQGMYEIGVEFIDMEVTVA